MPTSTITQDAEIPTRPRAPKADIVAGLVFIAIALWFLVGAFGLPLGSLRAMGPGYFPIMASAVLLALGVAIAANGFRSGGERVGNIDLRGILFLGAAPFLFVVTIEPLGMILSVFLVCLCSTLADARASHTRRVLSSVLVTAATVAIFKFVLRSGDGLFPSIAFWQ